MIILSVEDPKEKGKAFEEFISILLSKLGYKITNIRIRKSGRELDIEAISKVTGSNILVECKAEVTPINGPDFSKFYGVYEHEFQNSKVNLIGIMISLSGFNSEVISYYGEKDEKVKQRFKIYDEEYIKRLAVEAELIIDDSTTQHLARKSWSFDLGETLLVITKSQIYRIQLLQKDGKITHFIIYRAKGDDPTDYEIESLHKTIEILKSLEPFNLQARKKVLLSLC